MADDRCDTVDFPLVSVVLPAAGSGERMGMTTPKQFCPVLGKPLLYYTLRAFLSVRWLQKVVVVVSADWMQQTLEILQLFVPESRLKVSVVSGATTRHRSIWNGLKAMGDTDVVILHDAVRPFVKEDFLRMIVLAAKEHGAAGAVRPLISTVVSPTKDGSMLDHALERAQYQASEMPQAFNYPVIMEAYQKCSPHDLDCGTECLHLVQKYVGVSAKLLLGPSSLWKVTHKKDLYAVEGVLKEEHTRKVAMLSDDCKSPVLERLHRCLQDQLRSEVLHIKDGTQLAAICETVTALILTKSYPCDLNNIRDTVNQVWEDKSGDTRVVILLLCGETFSLDVMPDIFVFTQDLAKESTERSAVIYSVYVNKEASDDVADRAVAMVTSLLSQGDPALSGQVFVAQ